MDPYLLGLVIFMMVMAVGLSVFIGLEVFGLVRRITIDLSRAANSGAVGVRGEHAGEDEDQIQSFPAYQDRRTVERLIEHFEEEPE
jgi:hypothetical protein